MVQGNSLLSGSGIISGKLVRDPVTVSALA